MNKAKHIGIVMKADGGMATIRLIDTSENCGGCSMAMLCSKPETLTIPVGPEVHLQAGDRVTMSASGASRTFAMLMLMAVPLALLISGLWLGMRLGLGDLGAASCAVGICSLWFALLPLTKKALKGRIKFEIERTTD